MILADAVGVIPGYTIFAFIAFKMELHWRSNLAGKREKNYQS